MSETKAPPDLPIIEDEAADSPRWLPMAGIALFCALALLIAVRQLRGHEHTTAPGAPADTGTP